VLPPKDPPYFIEPKMKRIAESTFCALESECRKAIVASAVVSSLRLSPKEAVIEVLAVSKDPLVVFCSLDNLAK